MAVPETDLEIVQGETYKNTILVYSIDDVDDTTTTPSTYPLTGCDAHMQIRTAPGTTVLMEARSGSGITLDPATGTILLDFSGDMTNTLTSPNCRYDLWLLTPQGDRIPILRGAITVDLTITEPVANS